MQVSQPKRIVEIQRTVLCNDPKNRLVRFKLVSKDEHNETKETETLVAHHGKGFCKSSSV